MKQKYDSNAKGVRGGIETVEEEFVQTKEMQANRRVCR